MHSIHTSVKNTTCYQDASLQTFKIQPTLLKEILLILALNHSYK